MAQKFVLHGDALTAYKHSGSGKTAIPYDINAGGPPSVVADAAAIGGQAINYDGGGLVKGHLFPGFDNSTKTGIISVLARIAPTYSGSPGTNTSIISVAGPKITTVVAQLLQIDHLTTGNLVFTLFSPSGGTSQSNTVLGAWSPTAGHYYDICVTWTGTTAANGIKVYIDGVLFAQLTAGVTWSAGSLHTVISVGVGLNSIILGLYKLNEYVLWDSVIDPTASGLNLNGSTRASFVTVTGVLDPTNSVDPGIHEVSTGTAYTINGVALVGDSDEPAQANVRAGVVYDNGTKTGLLAVPAAADVRAGVSVDAGVGTCAVPIAANVRFGVSVDATTGTLQPVTNILTQASLIGQAPLVASDSLLYFSQGDDVILNLKALDGPSGAAVNLTGASFVTKIKGTDGTAVTIANSDHTADPDQVANKGVFQCHIVSAKSALMKTGAKKEIVTEVTLGGSVINYHGLQAVTVLASTPTV